MAVINECRETKRLQELRDSNTCYPSVKLFIAADIPQSIVPCLKKLQNTLANAVSVYPVLQYTPQEICHITLAYFGEQDMQKLEQIVEFCHNLQQKCKSHIFTAHFHKSVLKFFGSTISQEKRHTHSLRRGAAIAITLQSNLSEIAQVLTQEWKDLLQKQAAKTFTPHLTIGRIRIVKQKSREKHEHASALDALDKLVAGISVQIPNFTIPSFTLFESQGNGNYVPLYTCVLPNLLPN